MVASSDDSLDLSIVTSLDVDGSGRVYVADVMNASVLVLRPDGSLERRLGREGQGPGEFLTVSNVQVLPGDSLLVFDRQLGRVTVFSAEGTSAAYTTSLWSPGELEAPYWVKRLPGTDLLAAAYSLAYTPAAAEPDARSDVLRIIRPMEGLVRDSLLVFPSQEQIVERTGAGVSVTVHPFGRRGVLEVGQDARLYFGWTGAAVVEVFAPDGDPLHRMAFDARTRRVSPADVDRVVARYGYEAPSGLESLVGGEWPALRGLVVDEGGRVWAGAPVPEQGPAEWVMFSSEGERLTSVRLDPGIQLMAARGGLLYGVETDEWDVPRVVIVRAPS